MTITNKEYEVVVKNRKTGEQDKVVVTAKNKHDAECEANEYRQGFITERVKEL